ncbi:hypothetical protein [Poritiphilus flavus]|uniref:Uncharacterized protein n=1 Tax=Poritiphilus flavus TaxID=2697053 RepID=A0A6L9EHU2_9FLAO|nr:hypothetical protein [Poritiphilus flavus]NAS13789.1 hypothetical protein [Poritiphilus flavus]
MKKTFVLVVLFVLPIVAYLFFASGVNNFGRLPTLTEDILDINSLAPEETFKDKITILGFLGSDVTNKKGNAFNLNQKIYKRFYEFRDFQMIMAMPKGTEAGVEELKTELSGFTDISKWRFVFLEKEQINALFSALKTDLKLEDDLSTPYVFIVDKKGNLRGRKKDEDEGLKYGFNTSSVADLNNKMEDDVKIILAEYRLALKENNGLQE